MTDEPAPVEVGGDTVLQSEVLEDLSQAVNYRAWHCALAEPHLGDDPLEIGAGNGDHAEEWRAGGRRITVAEPDPGRFAQLRARFADDPQVEVTQLGLPADVDASHSSVVFFNVLEHIADDVAALASCRRLVRPGGKVVVLVPAFPIGMSDFDREIGHHRRYTVDGLRTAMEDAGLKVDDVRYVNPVGLVAWVVGMRLLRQRPKEGPLLGAWDRFAVPVLRRLEEGRRPPFGQSVVAVAQV